MAILAIDAGNTRIKWGVHDGAGWAARGALPTAESARLFEEWQRAGAPRLAIASNVAGPRVRGDIENACARMGIALEMIASRASQLGVTSAYRDPGQLGTDRWAALVGACALGPENRLVVNAGTAITVDALDSGGHFLGGLIVPGPTLMRRSLDKGTSDLRLTEGRFDPLPRATPDAITTGALFAGSGAVVQMGRVMEARGTPIARVVLSGGAAAELAPHLPFPLAIHENLVLEGLLLMARAD